MRSPELWALYLVVGAGCAIAVLVRRGSVVDAGLLFLAWPLYGPFVWSSNAQAGPLDSVLPDPALALRLERRVQAAATQAKELEALLERPELNRERITERIEGLESRGNEAAARVARGSLRNVDRLEGLRARYRAELEEVEELLAALNTQAEVLRLSGEVVPVALLGELEDRVQGLEAVLDDELLSPVAAIRQPPVTPEGTGVVTGPRSSLG